MIVVSSIVSLCKVLLLERHEIAIEY